MNRITKGIHIRRHPHRRPSPALSPMAKSGNMKVLRRVMILLRERKVFWRKISPSRKASNLRVVELSGTSTVAKSANTPIRTKTKRHVSVWSLETSEELIWEIRAARHAAVMGARNKILSLEVRTPSTIHKTRRSSQRKRRRNLRLGMAAAKGV